MSMKHVLKASVPLFVLALSAGAMSACGDNNSDTASTEPTVEEAPTTTAVEEPAALTAETTGSVTGLSIETDPNTGLNVAGEPTGEIYYYVEVLFDEIEDALVRLLDLVEEHHAAWTDGARWNYYVEVTMEDGSVRSFPADLETLELIWPDGTTTGGVRVVIEAVDGEQRITGLAE